MKITKFVHSCLLVEDNGKTFLIDPGEYSAELLNKSLPNIPKIDYLLITHEHFDHMDIPIVKQIVSKYHPKVMSTQSVKEMLAKEEIDVSTESDDYIILESVPHEKVLGPIPQNVMFHIGDKLSDPGDSHSATNSKEVLALPIQAPWGSMVAAVELALKLHPKVIIPIHDWHWKNEVRNQQYDRLEEFFKINNMVFIKPQDGIPFEI